MARAHNDVVSFDDADPSELDRLGGKGVSLVEMRRLGLSVPPGFIISTEVCRRFLVSGRVSDDVREAIDAQLAAVESAIGRLFGDPAHPLLVSVRSGAPVSMPGMMDTVLDLGLCDATVEGLADTANDARFAWDCYVRLLHEYGRTVRGIAPEALERAHPPDDPSGDIESLRHATRSLIDAIEAESGRAFPQDPRAQLDEAIEAVLRSWENPRAKRYRRYKGISDNLGTAVVVQAMVFGNRAGASGTGVAFTRDPATGARDPYGDFLSGAQGEDVVAGERDVGSLEECRALAPGAYEDLTRALLVLERRQRDMCEIEFTIEQDRLWILQSRPGQRTGAAAVRIAMDMIDEGLIDESEAIARIHPAAMLHMRAPVLAPDAARDLLGRGVAASPGAAVGIATLDPGRAEYLAAGGIDVVLVRPFTSPDDVAGMIAARGIVTAHGGRTSHAAVVARGMDRPAVCGVHGLVVTATEARFEAESVREGDEISIDGTTGEVFRGALPRVTPTADPRVERLLALCDARRRIPVWSEGTRAGWADGVLDRSRAAICRNGEELERAIAADAEQIVIDLSDAETAPSLVAAALELASRGGVALIVQVDRAWPAGLHALPRGPWTAFAATDTGNWAARVLAATTEPAN